MPNEYWPEDSETELYRSGETSIADILELVKTKWPETPLDKISIKAEYIHTNCLGYDLYDPSDYTEFIVITREKAS